MNVALSQCDDDDDDYGDGDNCQNRLSVDGRASLGGFALYNALAVSANDLHKLFCNVRWPFAS